MKLPRPTSLLVGLFVVLIASPGIAGEREDVSTTVQISVGSFDPKIGTSDAAEYHDETFDEELEKTIIFTKYLPGELIRRDYGQLGLRLQMGQWRVTKEVTSDSETTASLRVVPLSLGLAYRCDTLTQRWAVPLTGYASGGVASYLWYGKGPFRESDASESSTHEAIDATSGYFLSMGIGLNLDFLFNRTFNTAAKSYQVASLLVEWHRTWLNNFEDDTSPGRLDLSSEQWRFGIAIDF